MSAITRARLAGAPSQATFDVLMHCLAEPGSIRSLPAEVLDDDIPAAAWPILALADVDTAINANGDITDPLGHLISDATGAPIRPPREAWGVVLTRADAATFGQLATGDALTPELGAKVAIAVRRIEAGATAHSDVGRPGLRNDLLLRLTGPGVPGERLLTVTGLDPAVARRLGRASGTFPAGVDVWLVADTGEIVGIPRSTEVTEMENH